jgi:predicted permease
LIVKGVPVIISAMPVATFCAILTKEHGGNINLASQGIFMTTLLSLFTIPIVVFIYCNI